MRVKRSKAGLLEEATVLGNLQGAPADITDHLAASDRVKIGDPTATSDDILKLVDSENPPLRLLLGTFAAQAVHPLYEKHLKEWDDWADISRAANGTN